MGHNGQQTVIDDVSVSPLLRLVEPTEESVKSHHYYNGRQDVRQIVVTRVHRRPRNPDDIEGEEAPLP